MKSYLLSPLVVIKILPLLSYCLFCYCISPAILTGEKTYGDAVVEKVVSIIDGDSFRANIRDYPAIIGENIPVYIAGIASPPIRGTSGPVKELALKAKTFTESKLSQANVITLKNIQRGMYFSITADVYVDGKSLARELVRAGLGKKYYGGPKPSWP